MKNTVSPVQFTPDIQSIAYHSDHMAEIQISGLGYFAIDGDEGIIRPVSHRAALSLARVVHHVPEFAVKCISQIEYKASQIFPQYDCWYWVLPDVQCCERRHQA